VIVIAFLAFGAALFVIFVTLPTRPVLVLLVRVLRFGNRLASDLRASFGRLGRFVEVIKRCLLRRGGRGWR
jgi:hypothetical protein